MRALVGFTGFIGSNLLKQRKYDFTYNSKNIEQIKHREFENLTFAGLPGVKWKANAFPKEDLENIERIVSCLRDVKSETVTYISTIDVYQTPVDVDEDDKPDANHHAYGLHRAEFEKFMIENFEKCLAIRLPIVFGPGFKKNYLYDLMLGQNLSNIYLRNVAQFYDVENLSDDIENSWKKNYEIVNLATEPIILQEIVSKFFPQHERNCHTGQNFVSDMKTKHKEAGYFYDKNEMIEKIARFIK
jgi:nucleoside-diphosphate-sugar epimerase